MQHLCEQKNSEMTPPKSEFFLNFWGRFQNPLLPLLAIPFGLRFRRSHHPLPQAVEKRENKAAGSPARIPFP
jgi:hypothetical protein